MPLNIYINSTITKLPLYLSVKTDITDNNIHINKCKVLICIRLIEHSIFILMGNFNHIYNIINIGNI